MLVERLAACWPEYARVAKTRAKFSTRKLARQIVSAKKKSAFQLPLDPQESAALNAYCRREAYRTDARRAVERRAPDFDGVKWPGGGVMRAQGFRLVTAHFASDRDRDEVSEFFGHKPNRRVRNRGNISAWCWERRRKEAVTTWRHGRPRSSSNVEETYCIPVVARTEGAYWRVVATNQAGKISEFFLPRRKKYDAVLSPIILWVENDKFFGRFSEK